MILRNTCVYCDNQNLQVVCTFPNSPITLSPTDQDFVNDCFIDHNFLACFHCGSVQLRELTDPNVLYNNYHNTTTFSKLWQQHYDEFTKFILDNTNTFKVLEVGGYTGVLSSRLLQQRQFDYTVMDICSQPPNLKDVKFINGNCEEFQFDNFDTVIISHTFEHLFYPKHFVSQLSKANVQDIFVSIPNMKTYIQKKNFHVINVEHTFYCDEFYIKLLFNKYNYTCVKEFFFNSHSIFFHFKKTDATENKLVSRNVHTHILEIVDTLEYGKKKLMNIILPPNCYISPAGGLGQRVFYFLQAQSHKIIGFLDNDPFKINKRVYGANKLTYSPDSLRDSKSQINVFLYDSEYSNEIKNQYLKINPSICFV